MHRQSTSYPPYSTGCVPFCGTRDRPLVCLHRRPDAAAQRAVSCVHVCTYIFEEVVWLCVVEVGACWDDRSPAM